MKKIWKKFLCFWKELGNIITNVLAPFASLLVAAAELLQLPIVVIQALKKVEYWCFYACGTQKTIDDIVNKVDDAIDKMPDKKE